MRTAAVLLALFAALFFGSTVKAGVPTSQVGDGGQAWPPCYKEVSTRSGINDFGNPYFSTTTRWEGGRLVRYRCRAKGPSFFGSGVWQYYWEVW